MTDLISREAVKERLIEDLEGTSYDYSDKDLKAAMVALLMDWADSFPTIQPSEYGGCWGCQCEPPKHGKWQLHEYPDGYYYTDCSECGTVYDEKVYFGKTAHYCPNCGARMED